jgi:hypothetical protein
MEKTFKYPNWGSQRPGDYKQPEMNDDSTGDNGYPEEIDMDDVMVKGRWPTGTKKKKLMDIRGYGAATKGRKFHPSESESEE